MLLVCRQQDLDRINMLLQDPRSLDNKRDELAKARHMHHFCNVVACNANRNQAMYGACNGRRLYRHARTL